MIIRLPNGKRRGRRSSSGRGVPRSLKPSTVFIGARRTSVRLEPVMWEALADIAEEQARTIPDILTDVDRAYVEANLTAAIRVYIVRFFLAKFRSRKILPVANQAMC